MAKRDKNVWLWPVGTRGMVGAEKCLEQRVSESDAIFDAAKEAVVLVPRFLLADVNTRQGQAMQSYVFRNTILMTSAPAEA